MTVRYVSGANVADAELRERTLLATLLIIIYILYAAIGRDVFFNTLMLHTTPGSSSTSGLTTIPLGIICRKLAF